MYISLNWLKDLINIPERITPLEIAQKITDHTAEVESFVSQAQRFDKIVVGKVLEVKNHPQADRLRLTVVDVKTNKLNIVCGAPNVEVGQLVPVALIGAILPVGLEIKEAEIRGEKSFGMICAEDELGIGNDHEGIMVLKKSAKMGESFADYLKTNDIVFEIDNKSLSNRPDLLSHYGLSRELSVIFNLNLKPYEKIINHKIKLPETKNKFINIELEEKEACPRYMAIKIDKIKIKESPDWLKERLMAVNQKPINNIVDLTNYVLLELGQPLHAFSADKIDKILIRYAKKGEKIKTLDEKERILNEEDLLISSGFEPLALAGIMGGQNSGVHNETTSIILESANFKADVIRKTSQKLNLRTESSTRFEKALDPNLTEIAINRFLTLLKKILPEIEINEAIIDLNFVKERENKISLNLDWLNEKIGQVIEVEQVVFILEKLGFSIIEKKEKELLVLVPSWRATKDVSIKEDLVEEVLRIYGYDNIESKLPTEPLRLPIINQERLVERKIKNFLSLKHSLSEVYNHSFVGEEQLKKLKVDFFSHLQLTNPSSENHTLLRQSLLPNLINNIKTNQARSGELGFFEIGSVFFNTPGDLPKEKEGESVLPYQEKKISFILANNKKNLFLKQKGIVASLLNFILDKELELEFLELDNSPAWSKDSGAARIVLGGEDLGIIACLDLVIANNLGLKKDVVAVELSFSKLLKLINQLDGKKFKGMVRFPELNRDLAFVINKNITYNEFRQAIRSFNPLIKTVDLFDVYSDGSSLVEEKSLAFHLSFQSSEKTLLAEEVDEVIAQLINYLQEKFSAKLR